MLIIQLPPLEKVYLLTGLKNGVEEIKASEEKNTQTLFPANDLVLTAEEMCFSWHVPLFLLPTYLSIGPFSLKCTSSTQSLPRSVGTSALSKRD